VARPKEEEEDRERDPAAFVILSLPKDLAAIARR
jgi:hypothetical protein